MLNIRREQIAVFRDPAIKAFESRMLVHLNKFFPTRCQGAGEAPLREMVQYGIKSAAKYGIIAERDICKYIDLMVVYGRDFDRDPALPWARSILNDQASEHPSVIVDHLFEEAMKISTNRA